MKILGVEKGADVLLGIIQRVLAETVKVIAPVVRTAIP